MPSAQYLDMPCSFKHRDTTCVTLPIYVMQFLIFITFAESNILHRWLSAPCQNYYRRKVVDEDRVRLPMITTREDFHVLGRGNAITPPHWAQEVIVSHTYQFVYVPVRKVLSSTMRNLLRSAFNVSWTACGKSNCTFLTPYEDRCTTLCLSREVIQNYFFFTFVRHPVSRFVRTFHSLLASTILSSFYS